MNAALDLTPLAPTPAPEPLHLMEFALTMLDLTGKNFKLVNFVDHNQVQSLKTLKFNAVQSKD